MGLAFLDLISSTIWLILFIYYGKFLTFTPWQISICQSIPFASKIKKISFTSLIESEKKTWFLPTKNGFVKILSLSCTRIKSIPCLLSPLKNNALWTNWPPHIIVECKAMHVKISQDVFDQIARYNMTLKAKYLVVTNGLEHYYCQMNHDLKQYDFLKELPNYS